MGNLREGTDLRKYLTLRFSEPVFGKEEAELVAQALKQRQITNGGITLRFEEEFAEFCGGGVALAVNSCTGALHLSLLALGIGPGDEVIVPAMTHVATVHAVEMVGATPVFVDCNIKTGNCDPGDISAAITDSTKAIIVVHYMGLPVDLWPLRPELERKNIRLIEDCALALGARTQGVHVGLLGDVGCFSFYPSKHMTTGEGGMILTRRPELHEAMRSRREFGKVDLGDRAYDMPQLGGNFRMTEFQAALGVAQLAKLPEFLHRRKVNAMALRTHLKDYRWLHTADGSEYGLGAMVDPAKRDAIRAAMRSRSVETSIYYPAPVSSLSYYVKKYGKKSMPNAESIAKGTVTLSVGHHLQNSAMRVIADVFKGAHDNAQQSQG